MALFCVHGPAAARPCLGSFLPTILQIHLGCFRHPRQPGGRCPPGPGCSSRINSLTSCICGGKTEPAVLYQWRNQQLALKHLVRTAFGDVGVINYTQFPCYVNRISAQGGRTESREPNLVQHSPPCHLQLSPWPLWKAGLCPHACLFLSPTAGTDPRSQG